MRSCFVPHYRNLPAVFQHRFVSNFGVATASEVAAVNKGAPFVSLQSPNDKLWYAVDTVSRDRLSRLAGSAGFDANAALALHHSVVVDGKKPPVAVAKNPKEQLTNAKNAEEFFAVFMAALFQVRHIAAQQERYQLHLYGYNDVLNLGLKSSSQEKLNKTKVLRDEAVKKIAEFEKQKTAFVAGAFDTALFNDLLNLARACSNDEAKGKQLATKLLDEMTLCGVAPDGATEMLVRNIVFGDGPHEDSGLLFEFVEQPLMSEVSVAKPTDAKAVEAIADEALLAAAKRHQEALSSNAVIRRAETFPQLAFSPE